MPQFSLVNFPRYFISPYVFLACWFLIDADLARTVSKEMHVGGIVVAAVAGIIYYHIYRTLIYPLIMHLSDLLRQPSCRQKLKEMYSFNDGRLLSTQVAHRLFYQVMKDAVQSEYSKILSSVVHGFYQAFVIIVGFACYSAARCDATLALIFFSAAILFGLVAYRLDTELEQEELQNIFSMIPQFDAAAAGLGLRKSIKSTTKEGGTEG